MKITSSSTSAAVPSGPSTGAIIDWIRSIGLDCEVSTIWTGTAAVRGGVGEVTAVPGRPGSCVTVGAACAAEPPGSSLFNSSTVRENAVNAPPSGSRNACSLVTMFTL